MERPRRYPMPSGLDLLGEEPRKTGLELLGEPVEITKKVTSGLDLLAEAVAEPTPVIPKEPKVPVTTPPVSAFDPTTGEFDPYKTTPVIGEELKQDFMQGFEETMSTLESLSNQPMEAIRGAASFLWSLPGFAMGVVGATQKMVERIAHPFTINDLYEAAAEGMEKEAGWWHEKMVVPLFGEPTKEAEIVGRTAMAPLLVLSQIGYGLSKVGVFEDHENIQGILRFAGDVGGLLAMKRVFHASPEIAKEVEGITRKAKDIADREVQTNMAYDDAVKRVNLGTLKMEKVQLELRAKALKDKMDKQGLKEGVKEVGEKVEEVKGEPGLVRRFEEVKEEPKVEVKEPITEVDLQTGTEVPLELSTEKSPYRTPSEETAQLKELYEGRKIDDPDLMVGKLTNDVNRWLDGEEVDIAKVRDDLSNVAANADNARTLYATLTDFEQFKRTAEEAADWARKAEREADVKIVEPEPKPLTDKEAVDRMVEVLEEKKPGVTFYDITGATVEGVKQIVAGARKVSEYTTKARGMKAFKPEQAVRALREEFNREWIDRSGNIRRQLLDKLGDIGYEIIQKMYLSKGASSVAANYLRQMRKEVYAGLSKELKKILDDVLLADRMIDIAGYKTKKQFKYPGDAEPKDFIAYRGLFQFKSTNGIRNLTNAEVARINKSAKAYFEWMRKPLQDMLDSGLITEQEFIDLSSHNYRRIKLVDVFDKRYGAKLGGRKRIVYDSGIETLARGRETDIYEPSSEIMALEVFNRSYGRILNNEANKTLLELARSDPKNPFARVKTKGEKIPTGWGRIFLFEGGERKAIYLSPEMSREWITNNPELKYRTAQVIRYASGSVALRTFATGINWGFALANVPRDIQHIWFAARVYEDGRWKSLYNPVGPIYALQISRDIASVFSDAVLRKGRYQDYINEGGGMEFLVHQGRILQRGRRLEGPLDAMQDYLGYFGETSEIMTRLAIRERVIRRRAKEQGISVEEANKNKDITREATFAARDYMDFGQGGSVAKAADNGIPYLNASIQGTRGLLRAIKDNPAEATFKLAQYAAVVTGLYIAAQKLAPETMKNLKGSIDNQNNLCIPLGDQFGFLDDQGQQRYLYLKLPLDPGQKFFKTFFEASTDKWLGNEVDIDMVVDSLKEQSPVGVTELPPTISGALGYITNKDFWLNEEIWRSTEPFKYPGSQAEFIPGQTPQAYIDWGGFTGLSPERTKYMVEELTTSGTIWSWLLGRGYNAMTEGVAPEKKQQHLAHVLAKTPVIKRFLGVTNPYTKFATKIDKAREKVVLENFIETRDFDPLVEGYLYGKGVSRQDVFDKIRSYPEKKTRDRLRDRFRWEENIKDLPEKSFWKSVKGLPIEAKARVFVDRLNKANEKEKKQLWKEYGIVSRAGGVVSRNFRREVNKLRRK
jgi:hypothetical protein